MTNYKYNKMYKLAKEIEEIKATLKAKEKEIKELEELFIKDNPVDSKVKYKDMEFYYKNIISKSLDTKRLKEELKDVYEKYAIDRESTRFYKKVVL